MIDCELPFVSAVNGAVVAWPLLCGMAKIAHDELQSTARRVAQQLAELAQRRAPRLGDR